MEYVNKTRWIIVFICAAVVVLVLSDHSSKQAKAKNTGESTQPVAQSTTATKRFVWPKSLPEPKEKIVRQLPPKIWTNPESPHGDVFDRYTDKFRFNTDEGVVAYSVQEIMSGSDLASGLEKIGPIYLIHKRDIDGKAELVAVFFTVDRQIVGEVGQETGQLTYILARDKNLQLQVYRLNSVAPRSRPLNAEERKLFVDAYSRYEQLAAVDLVCESAIVIKHSRNGARVTGFGSAVPDYSEAEQLGSGAFSLTSFWVTNLYIFHPTKNIYYAQEAPSFWK